MSLHFKCPSCGARNAAPAEAAGSKVQCAQCGQKIRIPDAVREDIAASVIPAGWGAARSQPQADRYRCSACGGQFGAQDVYEQQGTYICKACFERGATAPAAASAGNTCDACGAQVGAENLQDLDGRRLCGDCAMVTAAHAAANEPSFPSSRSRAKRSGGWMGWAIGGGIAAVVALVAVIVVRSHANQSLTVAAPSRTSTPQATESPTPAPVPDKPAPPVDWESANAAKLAELQRQALSLQADGNYADADKKYAELFRLADSAHKPLSAALQAQLTDARSAWDDVKAKLQPPRPGPAVGQVEVHPDSPTTQPAVISGKEWFEQHREQLAQTVAEAEQQSGGQDKLQALLKYKHLFDLLGEHLRDVDDPQLKKKLVAALETRKRLLAEFKLSDESRLLTASTLISTGFIALDGQKWQAGLESLADARRLIERAIKVIAQRMQNEEYQAALEGMVVAYLRTQQVQKAGELLDGREVLGKRLETDPPRELLANASWCDILQRTKAMRAAKSIRAYLQKHSDDDELMLNLLGTALNTAGEQVQVADLWKQCSAYYAQRNAALEKTRPGQKRWGIEWLAAAEADQKLKERTDAIIAWQTKVAEQNAAWREYKRIEDLAKPRFNGRAMVRYATDAEVVAAKGAYDARVHEGNALKAAIPALPWLKRFDPVLPPRAIQVAAAQPNPQPATVVLPSSPPPTVSQSGPPLPPPTGIELPAPAVAPPVTVQRYALAFPVDRFRLVTAAAPLENAQHVRLEDADGNVIPASVVAKDERLALLEVSAADVPAGSLRYLNLATAFAGGPVRCAAIPEHNLFAPAISIIAGQAAAPPSQGSWDLNLNEHPRLAGSPLLDAHNDLVGVTIPARDDPRTKLPAATLQELREFLQAHGALPSASSASPDPRAVYQMSVEE